MSRLDELIAEHCPNGVRYVALGQVCTFNRGTWVKADQLVPGAVPVVTSSRTIGGYHHVSNREGTTIVVASSGAYAGFVSLWTSPIYLSNAFSVDIRDVETLNPRYLYRVLQDKQNEIHGLASGGGVPNVYGPDLVAIKVPVPPVPVQEEIARILDTFAELEAELETELEARKIQYAYYRDNLTLFSDETRRERLGELATIFGGLSGKSKADFENGTARYVSYVNVFNNSATDTHLDNRVQVVEGERQTRLQHGDVLFTGSSETAADVAMSSVVAEAPEGDLYLNSFCIGLRWVDDKLFDPQFTKHLFRATHIRQQLVQTASGVTRFNVSKQKLAKVFVPVPSIEDQQRIAAVLDKLEALVNASNAGIPAEIAARRQQYEHYRDRLLTFKELEA